MLFLNNHVRSLDKMNIICYYLYYLYNKSYRLQRARCAELR